MVSKQSLGGQTTAKKLRKEALAKYYENPNICEYCGETIMVAEGKKVRSARKKRFCNRSCAAKHNNRKFPKRRAFYPLCENCGQETGSKPGSSYKRKFCPPCAKAARNPNGYTAQKTKGALFSIRANWQSARSAIQRGAHRVYSGPHICKICGYETHVDLCHIRPVADFPDDTLISEINSQDNLVMLCPNHHREFDCGHLEL